MIEPSQETEESKPTEETETKESSKDKPEAEEKLFQFPLGTVKRIIKMDPDVNVISKDSIFLISKALEMFVQSLSIEAYSYTAVLKRRQCPNKMWKKLLMLLMLWPFWMELW